MQPKVEAVSPTNYAGARIQFDSAAYDFGRVAGGEQVKHTFYFTNTGVEDLILSNVHGTCHCTVVGNWARQVKPGESGAIPVVFDAPNISLATTKFITVNCNDRAEPRGGFMLQLKGVVWKPVDVIPPVLGLIIRPDSPFGSGSVRITNSTDQPMMLSPPECTNPLFVAHLSTNVLGRDYMLVVSNSAPPPPGYTQGVVAIKTSLTKPSVLNVTVWAHTQPVVSVAPERIALKPAPLATNQLVYLSIINNSTNPITVSEPSVDAKDVDITVSERQPRRPGAGQVITVMLKFPTGFELPGGKSAAFTAKTSHPQLPLVKVPIYQLPHQAAPSVGLRRPAQKGPGPTASLVRPLRPGAGPAPPPPPLKFP
jgi:hypothetical protein